MYTLVCLFLCEGASEGVGRGQGWHSPGPRAVSFLRRRSEGCM